MVRIQDRTVDIDKINDLPTYTGPTQMSDKSTGLNSGRQKRKIISTIIGLLVVGLICFGVYKGAHYLTGSGGKDITEQLSLSEEEMAQVLDIKFEDDENRVKGIQQYSKGKVTVRSGDDLNIVYINGKQQGVDTLSRKYRFFDVGINDPEQDAHKNMTFQYDGCMSILSEMTGGSSDTYYYYSDTNGDCFVIVVNKNTNRVVDMTYYYDYKKVTESLGNISE